ATSIATSCPLPAGNSEHITFSGSSCTTYWFALRTKDESAWSTISNSPSAYVFCPMDGLQAGAENDRAPHASMLAIEGLTLNSVLFSIETEGLGVGLTSLSVVDVLGREVFRQDLAPAAPGTRHVA